MDVARDRLEAKKKRGERSCGDQKKSSRGRAAEELGAEGGLAKESTVFTCSESNLKVKNQFPFLKSHQP